MMSSISDYFQTALVIDDRLEFDYRNLEALDSEQTSGLDDEPDSGLVSPPEEDETPIRPASLVRAFLDEGIVCSVLEPKKDDPNLIDLALRAAQIADLLILDWLLFGDAFNTVEAIRNIAEVEDGRLRVIVVFTGVSSLDNIAVRLVEDAEFETVDNFVLRRRDTVVLVFGKPGITLTGGEDSRTAASYSDLPRMIRDDLEMLYKGLMPRFVFQGVNVLRESMPRLLATFKSELDVAALVHRALLPESNDAGVQFIQLLVSNFEQALIEQNVNEIWSADSVGAFLEVEALITEPEHLAEKVKSATGFPSLLRISDDYVAAREAVTVGLPEMGIRDPNAQWVNDLTAVFGEGQMANERLASLMSTISFGAVPPRLEFGVVVEDESGEYWLCSQPLCDSVRLSEPRAFPMMPLRRYDKKTDKCPDAMILGEHGQFLPVTIDRSPHKLAMPRFAPSERGVVVPSGGSMNWRFVSVDGDVYKAVTRLRIEVATQAVQDYASMASRTGVDVSEWMRRVKF